MKKILRYLLLMVCLVGCLKVNVNAAENTTRQISLTGISDVKIYTADKKKEIPVSNKSFTVTPGEYCYVGSSGAGGKFIVTDKTTELKLDSVTFTQVSPQSWNNEKNKWEYLPDLGTLTLYDENDKEQQNEYWNATDSVYQYIVPEKSGESYYTFKFTPFDASYLPIEGHFYVYGETTFSSLNLSDTGRIPYLKKSYITVKAPADMEIYTTWQLKFYTARNWKSYEPIKEQDGYKYYEVPEGFTYMLRQEGKVTRYTKTLDGEWNKDHTVITVSPLENNPTQVHREQEKDGIYASMLTNLPENSEIDLKVGEYFDLVPLRAWQAVEDGVANGHNDPEWHYMVLGGDSNIASVEITKDDKIGQFGRIRANTEGTVLVAFYYDAVETGSITSGSSRYIYSALLPELTGIAVVHVGEKTSQTKINSNIDMIEGRTVYYVKSQKGADGIENTINDSAEYTFTPTAETNGNAEKITSVRVHKPITVTDGKVSSNPSDWLTDSSWTTYEATETEDGQQSYTINLSEGRNIVEIKAGDATTYHVILARGLDVTIDNVYRPGQKLEAGDTVKITLENMIPPMFKMAAIYNPSGVDFECKANGVDYTSNFGQYMAGSSFNLKLQDEDAGTYKITDGALTTNAWGASDGAHRRLTRNAMSGYWNGGDNPNINYGKMAYIPEISFEVESNDEYEESVSRSAGVLKALGVGRGPSGVKMVHGTQAMFATSHTDVDQNVNRAVGDVPSRVLKQHIQVGAELLQKDENAKLLVRYWVGNDRNKAAVQEMNFSETTYADRTGEPEIIGYPLPCTGKDMKATASKDAHIETIVIPSSGTPMTYATLLFLSTQINATTIIPKNITITAADQSESLGRWDGILEADDIQYEDAKGNIITQDLGYGFIGTEEHFNTSISNGTDKIVISVEEDSKYHLKSVMISVDGTDQSYKTGDAIPLKVGLNKLTVTCNGTNGNSATYTIDVTRRTAAKQTTFEIPDGASVLVMQGSKVMKPNEDGTYTLENGTYTYHVSKPGYLTTTDNFKVTDEEPNKVIKVMDLDPVPEQSGTVSVQLAGQSTVFCPTRDVEIQQTAEDLAANRYVQYNHGGYTVLHALLDAAKTSGTEFECHRGKFVLVDDSITESNGKKAGWVCKVNGIECSDPANTLVSDKDKIELFYNSGWNGMQHAWLSPENGEVTRGESMELLLSGADVHESDGTATTIQGAEIYDGDTPVTTPDGEAIVTTDENGIVKIDTRTLTLGTHYFTAVKKDEDGHNILTATLSAINVKKPDTSSADPTKTEVTFRLIGDTKHGTEGSDNEAVHAYTTWIATGTYTFDGNDVTVGQVFEAALKEAGLSYEGLEKNYISAITAPETYGGYELREKDNGKNSGWMYTVNGVHPSDGLKNCYVDSGDEIIWHYVDDYQSEQADMLDKNGNYVGTGNVSTWNKWLEALDETPGARDNASKVVAKINQIGDPIELTDECEEKITAARDAYEQLSPEEKRYVDNYQTLKDAEKELARLKKVAADQKAAEEVTEKIKALPDVKDLTLNDETQIDEARDAYSKLTDDQKTYVSDETKGKLVSAEEQMAKLLDAEAITKLIKEIEELPSASDITLNDREAIENAKAHYDALSEEQKGVLEETSPDSVKKLSEVIEQLNALIEEDDKQKEVDKVNTLLNELPDKDDVMFRDQTAVTEARDAYDALKDMYEDENLQGRISEDMLKKLTDAEERLKTLQEEIDYVAGLIEDIPAIDDLTVEDADQVQAARDAYEALNDEQKQKLTESGLLSDLLVAENQIGWLQKDVEAAKKVTDQINRLPSVKDLRLSDKTAVEAARYAYDNLSDTQKQYVSEDTVKALEEREAEIKRLEEVTPNPTPTPNPSPSDDPKQDEDEDSVTLTYQNYPVSVTGKLSGYELRLTALKADDDVVKQMQNMISSKEALIRLYDVTLYKDGKEVEWNDKLTVNFQVGTSYNGQTLSVLHEGNGKIETLSGTVSNSILSVTANSTGSFGVVVPASTVSTGNGSSNNGGSAGTVTNGNLGGGSTGTGNGTTAVSGTGKVTSAKTGDDTDILFPIAGLITATGVLAGIVLYYKKKKRITGVTEEE
jgi:LPXTG-motif cell wall-anchored protein